MFGSVSNVLTDEKDFIQAVFYCLKQVMNCVVCEELPACLPALFSLAPIDTS